MICILVRATYYWLVSQNKYLNKLILLFKHNSDNKWTYDIRSSDEFLVNSHLRTSLHSLFYFLIIFFYFKNEILSYILPLEMYLYHFMLLLINNTIYDYISQIS